MARRRDRPKTEAPPSRTLEGEPFAAGPPGHTREAAVYVIEGFGPRVVFTTRSATTFDLVQPQTKSCVHGRPLIPAGARFGGIAAGDRSGYTQVCRLCAFEVDQLREKRKTK